ncbi:MAG: nuclear transport factor 2 family protein [Microcoleaceae cyanobacterium]
MATSAYSVIQSFYEAVNRRDIPAAIALVDDNCIYQDLNFSHPFQGKGGVQQLLEESCNNIPDDLKFVIDDITTGDSMAVGVLWHVELDGTPFPNSRGVSFCRLSEETGKLIFARDIVEPPLKPGNISFFIIRLVTPLIRVANRLNKIRPPEK